MSEETSHKFSLDEFFNKNQKNITIAAVVLILVSGGLWWNSNYRIPKQEAEANTQAYKAEVYFGLDSINLALNGDGSSLGLKDIANEYSHTKSGERAAYEAGAALLKQGQYEEAIDYLKKVSFSDDIVGPLAKTLEGDCYSELGEYEKAASAYMNAADMADNDFTSPYALRKAGTVYSELEQWDKAYKVYSRIQDDYDGSHYAREIEKFVAKTKAKAGL